MTTWRTNPSYADVGSVGSTDRLMVETSGNLPRGIIPTNLPVATTGVNGYMSAADKTKLDGIMAGADVAFVSVKAYGATGNGSTNDTAAIQAAIDAAPTNYILHIPAGRYVITSALNFANKNVTVLGDGPGVTVLLCQAVAAKLNFSDSYSGADRHEQKVFNVHGLTMLKAHETTADAGGIAIQALWSFTGVVGAAELEHASFTDVTVLGDGFTRFWDVGIKIIDGGHIRFFNVRLENQAMSYNTRAAIEIVRNVSSNIVLFYVVGCYTHAFESAIRITHKAAPQTGTVEGLYIVNCELVSHRYAIYDDNETGGNDNHKLNGISMIGCHANCSKATIQMGWVSCMFIRGNNFAYQDYLDDQNVLACAMEITRTAAVLAISDNRFWRDTASTTTVPCLIFPGAPNVSHVRILNNIFNSWISAIHQQPAATKTQHENAIWVGPNTFEDVAARTASTTGFFSPSVISAITTAVSSGATIAFGQQFADIPTVVACHYGTETSINVTVDQVTTSNFVVRHSFPSPASISWIAAGKR